MKVLNYLLLMFLWACLSGCDEPDLKSFEGNYRGTWSTQVADQPSQTRYLTAVVKVQPEGELQIALTCVAPKVQECSNVLSVKSTASGALQLKGAGFFPAIIDGLVSVKGRPCWSLASTEFCATQDELTLAVADDTGKHQWLVMGREQVRRGTTTSAESRHDFTLRELIDKSFKQDYATRVEFQRYLESRSGARAAMLSLLPHVSTGTVANLIGGITPAALLQVVGDLMPFLLPSRWLYSREQSFQAQAERESFDLIRLNAGVFTEGVGYSIRRDEAAMAYLKQQKQDVGVIYREIRLREEVGQLQPNSSADVLAILNAMDQAESSLQLLVETEYQSISVGTGFASPQAVTSLHVAPEWDIEKPLNWTLESLQLEALSQSIELKQAGLLIQAAKVNQLGRFFTFLDPAAAPQYALGAALLPTLQQGSQQIHEFETIQEQTQASLLQKVSAAFSTYKQTLVNRDLLKQAHDIQKTRVDRMRENLQFGTSFVLADLVNALQDQMQTEVAILNNEALFQSTCALIQRLTLAGKYGADLIQPLM